jgi:uncharacterized protein involved in exopolysaccharide biosynthesis
MSRIDEALRRMTGSATPPKAEPFLNRFSAERSTDESNVSVFGPPHWPAEDRPFNPATTMPSPASAPLASSAPAGPAGPPAATEWQQPAETLVEPEAAHDDDQLFDVGSIRDYVGFLAGAVGRHKWLATGTFAAVLGVAGILAVLLPRTYHAHVKLLAQRNEVMTALSNPGRAVPWDADAPTRAAAETVLRRDNLLAIIDETNLTDDWVRTRAPILRLKDLLTDLGRGRKLTPDEKLDQLVGLLEARMAVVAAPSGDGTVSIDLDWPNAKMAYRLVETAQRTFLGARQTAEAASITESIKILEKYSATLHENIAATMAELERTQGKRRPAARSTRAARATAKPVTSVASITSSLPPIPLAALGSPALGANLDDPEIPKLRAAATAKKQELAALEQARQKQVSELETKLAQLSLLYTTSHPAIQAVQQSLSALSHDRNLDAMKVEVEKLEAEYTKHLAAAEELLQEEQRRAESATPVAPVAEKQTARIQDQDERGAAPLAAEEPSGAPGSDNDFASVRLRLELNQLESVLERIDAARIEMAVSQAAFKYRYTVINPAQVPRTPIRPNIALVIGAGLVGALILALGAAAGKDLWSQRILERWQVERHLGLPVLASVKTV